MIIKLLIHANCTLGKTALDLVMQANKAYSVFCLIKCGSVLQAKQGNLGKEACNREESCSIK